MNLKHHSAQAGAGGAGGIGGIGGGVSGGIGGGNSGGISGGISGGVCGGDTKHSPQSEQWSQSHLCDHGFTANRGFV
tara:strand:+ start:1776 stop:2006 length:231 start_codon:yes stop_codon:yes gene_type:complete